MTGEIGVVIVGAQKAASTTIAWALGLHDQIDMAPGEFHGFLDVHYSDETAALVTSQFGGSTKALHGFKCASYLAHSKTVAVRLHDDLAAPHIVATLRDPIQRAVSAWYWYVRVGMVPAVPFETGLDVVLSGEDKAHEWRHAREVLEWGLYAEHVRRYLEVFPEGRVHIVLDADLERDLVGCLAHLHADLGVARRRLDVTKPVANPGIYNLHRLRWINRRNRYVWHLDVKGVGVMGTPRSGWPRTANALVVGIDRALLQHVLPNRRPTLSSAVRRRLVDYYTSDVEDLAAILGRDLSAWLSPGPDRP